MIGNYDSNYGAILYRLRNIAIYC